MEVKDHSCLICSTSFEKEKWKAVEEGSELLFKFRRAFTVFCSLVGVDIQDNCEDQFDPLHKFLFGHSSEDSNVEAEFFSNSTNPSPCCEQCYKMFEEILLLQKAIEESKIAQTQLARNLILSLFRSTDNCRDRFIDDAWTKIRHQLICCLKKGTSKSSEIDHDQIDAGANSMEMEKGGVEANIEAEAELRSNFEGESGTEIEANMNNEDNGRLEFNCGNNFVSEVSKHITHQVKLKKRSEPLSSADDVRVRTHRKRKMKVGRKLLRKTVARKLELTCIRPCSVVVKRLSKSDIASLKTSTQPVEKNADVSSQVRKSKLKAFDFDFIRKSVGVKGYESEEEDASKSRKVFPKQVDLGKNKVEEPNDNLSDDEYLPDMITTESNDESYSETEKEPENLGNSTCEENDDTLSVAVKTNKKTRSRTRSCFAYRLRFNVVNENTLLCNYTLVTMSSENLQCQEPGCFKIVEGRDFEAYQSMLHHIKENHDGISLTFKKVQKCPLCSVEIDGAHNFRYHLLKDHDLHRLFCQVCQTSVFFTGFHRHVRRYHKKEASKLYSSELRRDAQGTRIKNTPNRNKQAVDSKVTCSEEQDTPNENLIQSNNDTDNFRCKNGPGKRNSLLEKATLSIKNEALIGKALKPTKSEKFKWNERRRMFFFVNDSTLICYCTLVEMSSEYLKCQSPGCKEFIDGTDLQAFQSMFSHIQKYHKDGNSISTQAQKCPLCPTKFYKSEDLRLHLLNDHKIGRVVCQMCKSQVFQTVLKRHVRRLHPDEFDIMYPKSQKKELDLDVSDEKTMRMDGECSADDCINDGVEDVEFSFGMEKNAENSMGSPTGKTFLDVEQSETKHEMSEQRQIKSKYGRLFYAVNKNTLLCKCTLVTFSPESLKCEEPGCTEYFEGTEFQTFNNMLNHIVERHEVSYSSNRGLRKCPHCSTEFKSAFQFRDHVLHDHDDQTSLHAICVVCQRLLIAASIRNHMVKFHKDVAKVYYRKPGLASEKDRMALKRAFKMNEPGEKRKKRVKHMDTPSTQTVRKADETFYIVSDSLMLYRCTQILYSSTHFTCREGTCNEVINGFDYFAFEELRKHIKDVHLKDMNYKVRKRTCLECNGTLRNGRLFRRHFMRKHNCKSCICTSCLKPVCSVGSLTKHEWLHKNAEEKAAAIAAGDTDPLELEKRRREDGLLKGKFECTECGKQFSRITLLKFHEKTHLPKSLRETFKCPEENCDVVVLSKPALRSHIERAHRPELASRPRICQICNARFHFRDGHAYRTHMLSHKKEFPFVCELCGKGFVAKPSLENHARAHSDERMFQCEYCTMSYKFPNNLRRHLRSAHKDLVPIPSAEERLKQTKILVNRPDFIGPRIAFPCEYCEKVFPLRSRMTKHLPICVNRPAQATQS